MGGEGERRADSNGTDRLHPAFAEKAERILDLLGSFLRPLLAPKSWELKMRVIFYLLLFSTQLINPGNLVAGVDLLDQLNALELQAGELSIKKEADCFKAIGNRAFCSCVRQKSPIGLSFLEYVAVLAAANAKVLPDLTDGEYRKMVETATVARKECAKNLP